MIRLTIRFLCKSQYTTSLHCMKLLNIRKIGMQNLDLLIQLTIVIHITFNYIMRLFNL